MKVRLILVRNCSAQYAEYEYAMEKQCKTIEVDLPITNDDAQRSSNIGYWQIVGYEEIKEKVDEQKSETK